MEGAIVVVTRHVVVGSDAGLLIQECTLGRSLSGRISIEGEIWCIFGYHIDVELWEFDN